MSLETHRAFFVTRWNDRIANSGTTCVVKRATGQTFSDATGTYSPTYTANYTGACIVRPVTEGEVIFGEEQVGTHDYLVFLPSTETVQLRGDLVDISSTIDLFLHGKQFTVENVYGDSWITKRTLICDVVSA